MADAYLPPSKFLQAVIEDEALLEDEANLGRLMDMTRDAHPENRDWAALLLAQQDMDTPEVRAALLRAAKDENAVVRAEAILGLAKRDRLLALPFLQKELARNGVALPIFEAAALVADASLVDDLRAFAEPSGDESLDKQALEALKACEAAQLG
jgi:hypothetical protein